MPRGRRWIIGAFGLVAVACGAFRGAEEEATPSPDPTGADAAVADGAIAVTPPPSADDAGPGPSACGTKTCPPDTVCTGSDFASATFPDEWKLLPSDNKPFVTEGQFLRSTGKNGKVSFLSTGDAISAPKMTLTVDLDVRLVELKEGTTPLGFAAWVFTSDHAEKAYLALAPNGKLTACTEGGPAPATCTGNFGLWAKNTWHHVTWRLQTSAEFGGNFTNSVSLDCGAAVVLGSSLPALAGGSPLASFQVGAPVFPGLGDYGIDVDNLVRVVERTP